MWNVECTAKTPVRNTVGTSIVGEIRNTISGSGRINRSGETFGKRASQFTHEPLTVVDTMHWETFEIENSPPDVLAFGYCNALRGHCHAH
jgi:hypothetical protein